MPAQQSSTAKGFTACQHRTPFQSVTCNHATNFSTLAQQAIAHELSTVQHAHNLKVGSQCCSVQLCCTSTSQEASIKQLNPSHYSCRSEPENVVQVILWMPAHQLNARQKAALVIGALA
jgi:hypothetical protein